MKMYALLLGVGASLATAGEPVTRYALFAPSHFEYEDCLDPCDCVGEIDRSPMRGTHTMIETDVGPLFTTYRLVDIDWVILDGDGERRHLTGHGEYRLGGEVAIMHQMTLQLRLDGDLLRPFDSGLLVTDDGFPEIEIRLETESADCEQYRIGLLTRPIGCVADYNGDFMVDIFDVVAFLNAFASSQAGADINGDTILDIFDVTEFLGHFESGC